MPSYQLPLQIKLNDAATFANFYAGDNAGIVTLLQQAREPYIYIWSAEAAGKTHLLQALCHAHQQAIYLPLKEHAQLDPAMLDGLEQFNIICLDDIQAIAGMSQWEKGVFNLYNRVREVNSHLCVTARAPARQLNISLPDLVSRLNWGPVFQLLALNDVQKKAALQMRASRRGFEMSEEVANYLINHYPRDMHSLFAILDKLDDATLQAKRKLTVPFIKQYI